MAHPLASARHAEITIHGLTFRIRRVISSDFLSSGPYGGNILLALMPRNPEDFAEMQALESIQDPELKQKRSLAMLQQRLAEAYRPETQAVRLDRATRMVLAGLVAIKVEDRWLPCRFVEGPAPEELPSGDGDVPIYTDLLPRGPLTILDLGEAIWHFSGGADPSRIERFRYRPAGPVPGGSNRPSAGEIRVGGAGVDPGTTGAGDCVPPEPGGADR